MNAWYKFILNVLFSKKSENKDWEMTDEEEDILAKKMFKPEAASRFFKLF